jgi:hypothetical protein
MMDIQMEGEIPAVSQESEIARKTLSNSGTHCLYHSLYVLMKGINEINTWLT